MCANGACSTPLDDDGSDDSGVVVDATRAYWFDATGTLSTLRSVAHTSSTYEALGTVSADVEAMAQSSTSILSVSYSATGSQVWIMPKAGGNALPLASENEGGKGGNARETITVSGAYAFWAGSKGVYRVPLSGGTSELWVKTSCVYRLQSTASTVFWSCFDGDVGYRAATAVPDLTYTYDSTTASEDFTVDASYLYFFASNGLSRKPTAGGAVELLVAGAKDGGSATVLTVDEHNVYFGSFVATSIPIFWAPKQAAAKSTQLWDTNSQVYAFASNDEWVYWFDGGGSLFRTPRP